MPERISRLAGVTAAILLSAQFARPCSIVQIIQNKVGKNAVIRVTRHDQPLVGSTVLVEHMKDGRVPSAPALVAKGVTNPQGETSFSGLPAGFYSVSVLADDKRHWLGNLEVSPEGAKNSRADYEMFPKYSPPAIKPLQASLKSFRGTVVDVTGAAIPNVEIAVYVAGAEITGPSARLKTTSVGSFTSELQSGEYVVVFSSLGFVHQKVTVSIDPKGWRGMLLGLALSNGCGGNIPGHESTIAELN